MRRRSLWLQLWVCAAFLLFANLGILPISGSEGRWAQVVREMIATGDWLHPTINGDPYYDKPLLTYWLAAIPALVRGGIVTEISIRIQSAIAALGTLAVIILMAKKLFNEKVAMIAGWLFATSFSFGFWGRLGEADMANLFFSAAAIAWFLFYRDKRSVLGYAGFFAICAVGAHAKGMGSIAVPAVAVIADLWISRTWKFHLCNWQWIAGAVIGGAVYAVPFVLASVIPPAIPPEMQDIVDFDGTDKTSGIALALRENVVRFFAPFDHKEPFYTYFIHLPRHLLPWTPLWVLALVVYLKQWKQLSANMKWVMLATFLIFLFFSLSGSKRHYYIMPILPYCIIMTAHFLGRDGMTYLWAEKLEKLLLFLYRWLPVLAFAAGFIGCALLKIKPDLLPENMKNLQSFFRQTAFASGCALAILLMIQWRLAKPVEETNIIPNAQLRSSLISVMVLMIFVFVYLYPATSLQRTEKHALKNIGAYLKQKNAGPENVHFYKKVNINAVYYLDMPFRIPLVKDEAELRELMQKEIPHGIFLISQRGDFESLPEDMRSRLPLLIEEYVQPWEVEKPKPGKVPNRKKTQLRILLPGKNEKGS